MRDAELYKRDEAIPWEVVVDDLDGTVHQVYGALADPTYLIDDDGRVAYYNMWTHAPTLHMAVEGLLDQDERGVVRSGRDRTPHFLPAMTMGWRALRRGLPQSLIDIETAGPGTGVGAWLGYRLHPVLAPITQRATPLPAPVKLALAIGAAATLLPLARWAFGRDTRDR